MLNNFTKSFAKLASSPRRLALLLLAASALISNIAYAHNTITGSVSPQVVAPGGQVTYTFVSDAVGTSADIVGLQITHVLPAGFTYVSGSCTQLNTHSTRTAVVNPTAGQNTLVFGTWTQTAAGLGVPAGATSCTYVVQVPAAAPSSCAPLTSSITKTGGSVHTDINVVNGVGVIVSTGGSPIIGASKTTSTPLQASGTSATYTIVFNNTGPVGSCPATNVQVQDSLPTGFTFASTGAIALNGGATRPTITNPVAGATTPTWGSFSLPAGSSVSLTFTANIATSQAPSSYKNNVTVTSDAGGATSGPTAAVAVTGKPAISKSFTPAFIATGDTSNMRFTLTNASPNISDVSALAFTDALPAGVTAVNGTSAVCGGTLTITGGNALSFTGGTLAAGFSCNIDVPVTGTTAGVKPNTTSVLSSNLGAGFASNTATLTVSNAPSISKAFAPTSIISGGTSALTFTIGNTNTTPLNNVTFTDSLVNMKIASTAITGSCAVVSNSPALSVGATALNLLIPGVPAGGCTVTVQVTSTTAGTNPNTASGVTSTQTPVASAVSNTANLDVTSTPEFTLTKSHVDPFPIGVNGVYTLTVKNIGFGATASSTGAITVTDTLPAGLTYVIAGSGNATWTCASAPPVVTCTTAAGFTLAAGANSVFAITVSVAGPPASVINTANVTGGAATTILPAAPTTDPTTIGVAGVNVSGFVYSDANHNLQLDAGETGTGLTLFAKLVPAATPAGPATQAVAVNTATGAYTFLTVASGDYIIVIDNNNTLADVTPTIPVTWVGTEMPTQTRNNVTVAATDLVNLNFGLFNGNTLTGRVFVDSGIGAGGVPNDGVPNGTETGLAAAVVKLTNAAGTTTFDSTVSDASGNYTLWIPNAQAAASLRVVETNIGGYLSTGGGVGNTAGTYVRLTDATTFTFTAGTNYTLVNFADVPVNTLLANGQQSALPGNVVFYSHTFTAGSGGSVSFSSTSPAGWPQALYRDTNCNGAIDAGELIISAAITVVADSKTCVILKETIPNGTPLNAQDSATVVASFSYTSAAPVLAASLTNTDLTTLGSAGLVLTKSQNNATPLPGSNIIYTISYTNSSNAPLSNIVISDATLSYTTYIGASCVLPLPAAISACNVSTQPTVGTTGPIKWTLTGNLQPAATGQVQFTVKVD